MLSERRKMLIALEEQYRHEVRETIEEKQKKKPKTRHERVLEFCNTNFGLFLLSTVFVSLFSSAFTWVVATNNASRQRVERRQQLRLEILNRLDEAAIMKTRFRAEYREVVKTALYGFRPGEREMPSWKFLYVPMYPDLQGRGLYSLLWELEELSDPAERTPLSAARRELKPLASYLNQLILETELPPGAPAEQAREFYQLSKTDKADFESRLRLVLQNLGAPPQT